MSSIKLAAAVVISTVMGLFYEPVAHFISVEIAALAKVVAP